MTIFWLGLAFLFILLGLFVLTQNTQTIIGIPMVMIGVMIIVALSFVKTHASDINGRYSQSQLKPWFDSLKSGRGPCCSDADGSAVSDPDWETNSGHYKVRIDGDWYDVPDEALITEPNRIGRAMVWPMRGSGGLSIRCFMPGSMT